MINGDYILVVAPDDYPGKKYRDRYCYEHHLVYWNTYGIIPKDEEIIHHKDGNKHNNDISNLELLTSTEHKKLHGQSKLENLVILKCPNCESMFIRTRRNTHLIKKQKYTACSRSCSGFITHMDTQLKQQRISENIVEEFKGKIEDYS